ncbi:hypothetical protein K438DRAFT_2087307, partial [Mycena galopus ATCC 62051]
KNGVILGQLVGIAPTIIAVRVGLGKSIESVDSFMPMEQQRVGVPRTTRPSVAPANAVEDWILYLRPDSDHHINLQYSSGKVKDLYRREDPAWEEPIVTDSEIDSALNKWVDSIPEHYDGTSPFYSSIQPSPHWNPEDIEAENEVGATRSLKLEKVRRSRGNDARTFNGIATQTKIELLPLLVLSTISPMGPDSTAAPLTIFESRIFNSAVCGTGSELWGGVEFLPLLALYDKPYGSELHRGVISDH